MRIISVICLAVATLVPRSTAFPTAAGHCAKGGLDTNNSFGNHGSNGYGQLSDDTVFISFDGVPLDLFSERTLSAGRDYTVRIEAANPGTFKGFLVRAEAEGVDLSNSFTENSSDVGTKTGCATGVGAMTHNNRNQKQSVEFTFNHPAAVNNIRLDVTVVISRAPDPNAWHYSLFSLKIEDSTPAPTPSPTSSPTSSGSCPADSTTTRFAYKMRENGNLATKPCSWLQGRNSNRIRKVCTQGRYQIYKDGFLPASRMCQSTCCEYKCVKQKKQAKFIEGTTTNDQGVEVENIRKCGWLERQNESERVRICNGNVDFTTNYGQASEVCTTVCDTQCS